MYLPLRQSWKEVFHVHTKRCGHATGEDRDYIDAAIALGAERIVFTDHVPFPGDPFKNRMSISQYDEYLDTMTDLQREYAGRIEILKGFEVEYLPSFRAYYEQLRGDERIDVMVLGQHFYECMDGSYSFSLKDRSNEYPGLIDAICAGAATGYFDVIAHPDRVFKRYKGDISTILPCIYTLRHSLMDGMRMEYNYSSRYGDNQKWFGLFWERSRSLKRGPSNKVVYGYDAHSPQEMTDYWNLNYACFVDP